MCDGIREQCGQDGDGLVESPALDPFQPAGGERIDEDQQHELGTAGYYGDETDSSRWKIRNGRRSSSPDDDFTGPWCLYMAELCPEDGMELTTPARRNASGKGYNRRETQERSIFWRRMYLDSVAHLTFDKDKTPELRSATAVRHQVESFFGHAKFTGNYVAVTEGLGWSHPHVHVAFESGSVSYRDLHRKWYLSRGICEFLPARSRHCDECDWQKCRHRLEAGSCGSLEYVASKLWQDGCDGELVFERMRRRPPVRLVTLDL